MNLNSLSYFTLFQEEKYYKLFFKEHLIGYLTKDNADIIRKYLFDFFYFKESGIYLNLIKENFNNITDIFNQITNILAKYSFIKKRNEYLSLYSLTTYEPIAKIERSIAVFFGFLSKGIHINGYTKIDNQLQLWIAKRSSFKLYPNKYDNIVAGAISYGFSPKATAYKEALEEAGILEEYIKNNLTLETKLQYKIEENQKGIRNDIIYLYNLELPDSFKPINVDKEVSEFFLFKLSKLYDTIKSSVGNFKFNSILVILYFLWQKEILSLEDKKIIEALFNKLKL